jgi:hypothetical protein
VGILIFILIDWFCWWREISLERPTGSVLTIRGLFAQQPAICCWREEICCSWEEICCCIEKICSKNHIQISASPALVVLEEPPALVAAAGVDDPGVDDRYADRVYFDGEDRKDELAADGVAVDFDDVSIPAFESIAVKSALVSVED